MKLFLSNILYYIGDFLSLTIMKFGYGWKFYNRIMLWSVDLDKNGKIWKFVKTKKNKKKK